MRPVAARATKGSDKDVDVPSAREMISNKKKKNNRNCLKECLDLTRIKPYIIGYCAVSGVFMESVWLGNDL